MYGPLSRGINMLGPFFQYWSRGVIVLALCIVYSCATKSIKMIARKDVKWFFFAGLFASFVTSLFFLATNHLELGQVFFLMYGGVITTNFVLGRALFQESVSFQKALSLGFAIVGTFLIFNTTLSNFNVQYSILALLAGVFFSAYAVSAKKISTRYSSSFINAVSYVIIIIVNFLISSYSHDTKNFDFLSNVWMTNIAYGVVTFIAILCITTGYRYVEAQKGGLILLSELIIVLIIGALFYKEVPGVLGFIGSILILCGMAFPYIKFEEHLK